MECQQENPLLESYTNLLLKGDPATKLVDMEGNHRMLLKFITDCFFQKGGGSDQPSLDHKLVLLLGCLLEDKSSKIPHASSVLGYQRRNQREKKASAMWKAAV